jgi:hypothetical protein
MMRMCVAIARRRLVMIDTVHGSAWTVGIGADATATLLLQGYLAAPSALALNRDASTVWWSDSDLLTVSLSPPHTTLVCCY